MQTTPALDQNAPGTPATLPNIDLRGYGQVDAISFIVEEPNVGDHEFFMPFAGHIYQITSKLATGSAAASVLIDAVAVTGMSAIPITTTRTTVLSSDKNIFTSGQVIHLNISSVTAAVNLEVTIAYRRDSKVLIDDLISGIAGGTVRIGINELITAGPITAGGNITAPYFIGNGSLLAGLGTLTAAEPPLGNPVLGDSVLLSTQAGVRKWTPLAEINAYARGVRAGGSDQYALIQSLIDEASANFLINFVDPASSLPTAVGLPAGRIFISHPLEIKTSRVRLHGDKTESGTQIAGTFKGPLIYVGGPRTAPFSTGASLATGVGASLSLTATQSRLHLSVYSGMNLDTLTEFTAELFVQPLANVSGSLSQNIVSSWGTMATAKSGRAFWIFRTTGTGLIGCYWRNQAAGTPAYQLITGSTVLLAGVTYHIALVVHSGTVTLYCNGVSQGSFSESGLKVRQEKFEEVTIGTNGDTFYAFYQDAIYYACMTGQYDSIRFSNTARYTAPFTAPTAKFASDASTLLLLNGEVEATWVIGHHGADSTNCFVFNRRGSAALIGGNSFEDLTLLNGGLFNGNSYSSIFRRITVTGAWQAMDFNTGYASRIQDCNLTSNGRFGLLLNNQNEEMSIDRLNLNGGFYPFVIQNPGGGDFRNISILPHTDTDIAFVLKGNDMTLTHYQIDDEGGGMDATRFGMLISSGLGVANINGGQMDFGTGAYTPFWVDGGGPVNINGATLYNYGGAQTEMVKVTDVAPPITLLGCHAASDIPPLTTSTESVSSVSGVGMDSVYFIDKVKPSLLSLTSLPSVGTTTVSRFGAAGTTTYSYVVVAVKSNTLYSPKGPTGTTTTGNATLSGSAFNAITWALVPGARRYDIYRTVAGGTSPTTLGKIGTSYGTLIYDAGLAGDGTTAPTTNTTSIIEATGTNASITLKPSGTGGVITAGIRAQAAAAPTIASAATIAPTSDITFVSGTFATVATITPPPSMASGGGTITLIPTGVWTTTTSGNIAVASTAVVNKPMRMVYDSTTTKWYSSY